LLASQLPSIVEVGPPLNDLISACPFWLCQKPMVAVSPPPTKGGAHGVTLTVQLEVADTALPVGGWPVAEAVFTRLAGSVDFTV
jgi:hypothetical protein